MSRDVNMKTLDQLQREAFAYFLEQANPDNGLVVDCTRPGFPSSIAAVGLALAAYPLGVERGFMTRRAAVRRVLATLRFFWNSPQSAAPDATGYQGFYYHFLEMKSGRRAWNCELSTIDTTLLIAGALAAGRYFDGDGPQEREIRELADALYRRVDWQWAQDGGLTVTHGWTPEEGFLPYRWSGYDEAMLLYLLGLGSPTHPLPPESYAAWTSGFEWRRIYDFELVFQGPLFIHQYSQMWVDLRGLRDTYMRARRSDYFENSRRAVSLQREYAIRNPEGFAGYHDCCWGFTASDGPGPQTRVIHGIERRFYDYLARGAPFGPDDGTIAPWATVACLPFAPEIVLPTIQNFLEIGVGADCRYGFEASFNPTFEVSGRRSGWTSPWNYGLNQGPLVLMVENYRSEMIWNLMRQCACLVTGLRRAGFTGGWLEDWSVPCSQQAEQEPKQ